MFRSHETSVEKLQLSFHTRSRQTMFLFCHGGCWKESLIRNYTADTFQLMDTECKISLLNVRGDKWSVKNYECRKVFVEKCRPRSLLSFL